jgi:glutamate formiminotransferase/formiminotetrahydrofolate cyclodeaminase
LRLRETIEEHVLERRILERGTHEQTLQSFVDAVGSDAPVPGGGSVAAHVGALSAALTKMVAGLMLTRPRFATVHGQMTNIVEEMDRIAVQLSALTERDAEAYATVMQAYQLPRETENEITAREDAIREALWHAARVPLQVARLCARVVEVEVEVVKLGASNAITDVGVAALMTEAACKGAAYNVEINVNGIGVAAEELREEVKELVAVVGRNVGVVTEAVRNALNA